MSSNMRDLITSVSLLLLSSFAVGQSATAKPSPASSPGAHPVVHEGVAVTVKVDDFEAARQKVIAAATAHGGKIADAKIDVSGKGRKSGWMRITVPADQLRVIMPEMYGLGKLYGDKMLTSDKTSEFETLARRMDQLGKHQTRLSGVLGQPRRMRGSDILYLQERLFRAGVDEESLAQQRLDIARRSASANVILTMFEPIPVKPAPKLPHTVGEHVAATFSSAWISFRRFGLRVTGDVAFLLVYAVVWLPIAILSWILGKRIWKKVRPIFVPDNHVTPPATPA